MGSRARTLPMPPASALRELTEADGLVMDDAQSAIAARTGRTLVGACPPCTPDRTVGVAMTIQTGDLLAGKYEAGSLIGSGACSFVLAAFHRGFDSEVALKFFSPELVSHEEAARRFAVESRNSMRLRSEHIVRVFDVDRLANGQPFLVMERLRGYDLRVALGDRGRLSIERSLEFALQVCEALATAHAVGLVHLDLKPENLFVTGFAQHEQLKVLDFGICREVHESSHRVVTLSAQGSPPYMSPEQMRGSPYIDERSDLWSLGCVLYEMLTGRSPFARASLPQACAAVLEEPVQRLRELRPEVPRQLEAVVMRCLEKDVEQRPQTVVELAHALAKFAPSKLQRHALRCQQILEEHGHLRKSGVHALADEAEERVTPVLLTRLKVVVAEAAHAPRPSRRYGLAWRRVAILGLVGAACYASLRPSPKRVVAHAAAVATHGELCELPVAVEAPPEPLVSMFVWGDADELVAPAVQGERRDAAELRRAARRERRERAREETRLRALAEETVPPARDMDLDQLDLTL